MHTAKKAREIDEKHQVVENTKKSAISVIHMAQEMNEKHQVTNKLMNVAKLTIKSLSKVASSVDDTKSKKDEEEADSTNNGSPN